MILRRLAHRDIDPVTRALLVSAGAAADSLQIQFFVSGALARDFLLYHVFGQEVRRATADVDLGISIADWGQFHQLKELLCETGEFRAVPGSPHRLHFGHPATPLDLIPFGSVESPPPYVRWPPEHTVRLNVTGFSDAYRSAVEVDLGDQLIVRTSSLASLAVLKLIAWNERKMPKDVEDFLYVAETYLDAGNLDRFYAEAAMLMKDAGGQRDLAAALLLGKDAIKSVGQHTAEALRKILDDEEKRQLFIDHLVRANARNGIGADDEQRYGNVFNAFRAGFING